MRTIIISLSVVRIWPLRENYIKNFYVLKSNVSYFCAEQENFLEGFMLDKNHKLIIPTYNPRARFWDPIPSILKVLWKEYSPFLLFPSHHNLIIPKTKNHEAWVLGAQPGTYSINKLLKEYPKQSIQIVSMITANEAIKLSPPPTLTKLNNAWHDHSVLNITTGKNETVKSMLLFQMDLQPSVLSKNNPFIYCHCMAGRSRSLIETIVAIYFYSRFNNSKKSMFDFDASAEWNPIWDKIKSKIGQKKAKELKLRLQDQPSFTDITEFVTLQRPDAKDLTKVDGDQAGLVGLIALEHIVVNQIHSQSPLQPQPIKISDILDIGLMLKAPLDLAFRDKKDRNRQENNLVCLACTYNFQLNNGSIFLNMLPKVNKQMGLLAQLGAKFFRSALPASPTDDFDTRFSNLTPNEQARLAILMKGVTPKENSDYEDSITICSYDYAKIALKQSKKLTAGDQVELLRAFSKSNPEILEIISYKAVAKKIAQGNRIDRYNAGIQLFELYSIAQNNNQNTDFISNIIGKLDYREQYNFLIQLADKAFNPIENTEYVAKIVLNNYNTRWFKKFNHPLSQDQKQYIEKLANTKAVPNSIQIDKPLSAGTPNTSVSSVIKLTPPEQSKKTTYSCC